MLRIDRQAKVLKRLEQRQLPQADLKERYDVQQMIRNSPEDFFKEMGESLLLIGEEVKPADFVNDRIDLLAIDQNGSVTIIELKRGAHKLQLLQALSYAAMISKWDRDRLIGARGILVNKSTNEVEEEIEQFLLEDIGDLNQSQRIVLLAEDFDYEVLVTAEWLTEQYDFDIRCYRMTLSAEMNREFLTCICIFPPPEITQHAVRRTRQGTTHPIRWENWDDALSNVNNKALVNFFKHSLEAGVQNYLGKRILQYWTQGRRLLDVMARSDKAYVWQKVRFKGDEQFWVEKLGSHIDLVPVRQDKKALRFFLKSEHEFAAFSKAVKKDLAHVEFLTTDDLTDLETE